jgi:K+-sensing histidine kinase KdpD
VALIVDVDPEMPPIPVDTSMMHQAVMNLMTNALEAVEPQRGAVTCRAAYHTRARPGNGAARGAEINVIDNGIGIPPEKLALDLRTLQHHQGAARHGARARRHQAHRRRARRARRGLVTHRRPGTRLNLHE